MNVAYKADFYLLAIQLIKEMQDAISKCISISISATYLCGYCAQHHDISLDHVGIYNADVGTNNIQPHY
jgi:hypothetical protein